MHIPTRFWMPVIGLMVISGCGGDTTPEDDGMMMEDEGMEEPMSEPAMQMEAGTVSIVQPADGAEVAGPNVEVVLETTGLRIVESGVMEPGTGHHHLFLDVDVSAMDVPIPSGAAGVIHKGDGTSVHTLEGVAPGEHRLIAVIGDGAHIPVNPSVVDTITFTVTAPAQE